MSAMRREPWTILLAGYLCIKGLFETAEVVFELREPLGLIDDIRRYFFNGYDWSTWWSFGLPFRVVGAPSVSILLLIGGIFLWLAPIRFKPIAALLGGAMIVSDLMLLIYGLCRIAVNPAESLLDAYWIPMDATGTLPGLLVIWFAYRGLGGHRSAPMLLAAYLIAWGGQRVVGNLWYTMVDDDPFWEFCDIVSRGPLPHEVWRYVYLTELVVLRVITPTCLVLGILLWRNHARMGFVAQLLLVVSAGRLLSSTMHMADPSDHWDLADYCRCGLLPLALAIFLTFFVRRYATDSVSKGPGCRRCGYDLTGNVSGVCPECGEPT